MGRVSSRRCRIAAVAVLAALTMLSPAATRAQEPMIRIERERVEQMLRSIGAELKKNYYDPTFGGHDMDGHLKAAAAKLETATSLGHGMAIVALRLLHRAHRVLQREVAHQHPLPEAASDVGGHVGCMMGHRSVSRAGVLAWPEDGRGRTPTSTTRPSHSRAIPGRR